MSANGSTSPPAADAKIDRGLILVASVVVLGAIMSILDTTVVNVAINTLARDFDAPLSTIQWVATGYTLALATVIPVSGWAADRFGTKRLYLMSIALFLAGSMLSGAAWSAETLILFRILQGLGGGMLMPAGMTILTRAAGPSRVGRVMAIIGVPMLLGPVLGPILGGWLVDSFSWRWIFFINLPIGIAAIAMAFRVLPTDVPAPQHRFDWLGLALLSPGLAALIYGLAESNSAGGFGATRVLVPLIAGVVMLALFVVHGLRTPHALIDLRLFKNRIFSAASATLFLVIIAAFGGMLLMPLYFQSVRGESAMTTGLLLAPQGLGAMLAMPLAGQLADRTGIGRIVPGGLVLIGASFVGLTQLGADTSYWLIGALLFVMGLGMGFTMMPTFTGALQTLRHAAIARASTTLNIDQQVGASVGTAVLSVILAHELASRFPNAAGGGIGAVVPDAVRERVAPMMADAYGATFWYAVGLVVVAFLVAVTLLPKHKPEPVDEPGDAVSAEASEPVLMH
ncbi:DHA2 family efflux MFS transporter permease subunit [Capillimicrobium parvum]|uniref:Multidrug resistance protein MdtD n=1 Tax=Capillimicrobium parvum TaxID=2884022 RepID=A0A9E6XZA1_9ACTN|nr:DHA2 family efflux MFS transporter permease subunit [Capillimicrobium parvum]UGS37045.1 Putative multidrug resistance protein MdtD [Capillimicrobium parvum]